MRIRIAFHIYSILLLLVIAIVIPSNAQDGVTVRPLSDLLGESPTALDTAVIAPDGERIAHMTTDRQLCVVGIDDAAQTCTALPESFFGSPVRLHWSPDSEQIAFTEWWLGNLIDGDLWLWTDDTITNLTDDGDTRLTESTTLDYSPFWSLDGALYFFRSERVETPIMGVGWDVRLMRFVDDADSPETVRDLSGELPALAVVDSVGNAFFDGAISLSPDGETLALAAIDVNTLISDTNGIYTLALDGETPAQRRAEVLFNAGVPRWVVPDPAFSPFLLSGMTWVEDDLLVGSLHVLVLRVTDLISNALYRVDLDDETVTPRFDYTIYDTNADFVTARTSGFPDGVYVANYAILLNDDTMLALSLTENGRLVWVAPISDDDPQVIWQDDTGADDVLLLTGVPSVSDDGRWALLNGLLISLPDIE